MRRVPALLVTAGLVIAALTGCSAPANSECIVHPGNASKLVSVSGDFGSPHASFPTPLIAQHTQRSFVKRAKGTPLVDGQVIGFDYAFYDAVTGKQITDGSVVTAISEKALGFPGLANALQCTTVGSRVAIVISSKDGASFLGAPDGHAAVAVADVTQSFLARADGTPRPHRAGFPTVVLAPNGQPGIKVPKTSAPEKVETAVLRQGHGQTIKKHDRVVVHYTGVLWSDNTVFDSTWRNGSPIGVEAGAGGTGQGQLVPGAADALVGTKIGSQIVVIVPPDKGYGEQGSGTVPAHATLAYVIDVLGVLK